MGLNSSLQVQGQTFDGLTFCPAWLRGGQPDDGLTTGVVKRLGLTGVNLLFLGEGGMS